jgi:hypothetical protein
MLLRHSLMAVESAQGGGGGLAVEARKARKSDATC